MSLFSFFRDYQIEKEKTHGKARSSQWPSVRKAFLVNHPICSVCGGKDKLEVHHIKPFHLYPELELRPTNLITLCESGNFGVNCHEFIGHAGDFSGINPQSVADALYWKKAVLASRQMAKTDEGKRS